LCGKPIFRLLVNSRTTFALHYFFPSNLFPSSRTQVIFICRCLPLEMPRNRRTREQTRGPNIGQLSAQLGFADAVLPKLLLDFWSPNFPDCQFADAKDEQIAQIAEDFLEQQGPNLWNLKGGPPVYPDDKDKFIKPRIFEILKLQRRNKLDVRTKRNRRQ